MRLPATSKSAPRARRRGAGYTLTELMVALGIAGILMGVAVPSFNHAIMNSRLTGYTNDLVATTLLARGEAIKRNVVVTLCPSADGATCAGSGGWEQGYIVTCEQSSTTPGTCNVAPGTASSEPLVLATQKALGTGYKIIESNAIDEIAFRPTGSGATAALLTVCRNTPIGTRERVVRISATGRTSVTKTETGLCP